MNTTLHQNRPEDTQNCTKLSLEPYDYRIYYVNVDLRHQYGISAAESQTFLRAERPQRRRARRNGCFRRASRVVKISVGSTNHNNLLGDYSDMALKIKEFRPILSRTIHVHPCHS